MKLKHPMANPYVETTKDLQQALELAAYMEWRRSVFPLTLLLSFEIETVKLIGGS